MLVVMEAGAGEQQIERVIERMIELGLDVHRSSGMMYTVLGGIGDAPQFDMAELREMAGVREAIRITSRWKLVARKANPQGTLVRVGEVEVGRDVVARLPGGAVLQEVWESSQVRVLSAYADGLIVPQQSMENEALLRELGKAGRPVILKRGECATVDDWLTAAESVVRAGNRDVLLCESGVRTFAGRVLDVGGIAEARGLTHLPVIASAWDVTDRAETVAALERAATAAGAQGLLDHSA